MISFFPNKDKLSQVIDSFVYVYCTVFFIFSNAALETERYANFVAIVLMVLLVVYGLSEHSHYISPFSILSALFSLYCFLGIIWAADKEMATMRAKTVLKLLVLTVLLYNYCVSEKKKNLVVNAVFVAGVFYACFFYLYYGHKAVLESILSGSRIGWEVNDQNQTSFLIAMSAVVGMYFFIFEKRYWTVVPLGVEFTVILATGSREGFFCFFAGLFILIFLCARGRKKIIAVGIIIALAFALYLLRNLPFLVPIVRRIESAMASITSKGDGSTETRISLIRIGLQIFKEHPVLGIGMGSVNTVTGQYFDIPYYLHNNYAELLACGGIIGFGLYYILHLGASVRGLAKKRSDNLFYLSLTLIIVLLISEMATVSYYDKLSSIVIMYSYVALMSADSNG